MAESRRNPKRKATDSARKGTAASIDLLEEALRPLEPKEIEEWEGWIELESEPAFFNIILRDLGVSNVKAQEIFTIDQSSLDILPKPVYGLIFLFQYHPSLDDTEEQEETNEVWFANQTTNNACATVALLNIVMNAPEVQLGDSLLHFKESTMDLNTALRGHRISSNKFIRTIHNSFTRRMDHLNADLALQNEVSDAGSKKAKTKSTSKKGKKKGQSKVKASEEYGFHFVAYVPAGGLVWELDGLKTRPLRLGSVDSLDWTAVARPHIEARMLQYEESQLSFNLLALCQSPLAAHSQSIARGIASLRYLLVVASDQSTLSGLFKEEDMALISNTPRLFEFNITEDDLERVGVDDTIKERVAQLDGSIEAADALRQELIIDVKATMGEYRAELIAIEDDEQRVEGRKKDYAPALHKWATTLAEKGVLEEVINTA